MRSYSASFYEHQGSGSRRSAETIVPLLLSWLSPRSVVDVGCGTGAWLATVAEHGIADVLGIDGPYVDPSMLHIPSSAFHPHDLTHPLRLDRTFDLALCLEVAEHLPASCGPALIDSLTRLAPAVCFSAAIPFQGGTHHINERWQSYWASLFVERGYAPVDAIRPLVWTSRSVDFWYAQNIVLYINEDVLARYPELAARRYHGKLANLAVVHPLMYLGAADPRRFSARKSLELAAGAPFTVVRSLPEITRALRRRIPTRRTAARTPANGS